MKNILICMLFIIVGCTPEYARGPRCVGYDDGGISADMYYTCPEYHKQTPSTTGSSSAASYNKPPVR